MYLGKKRKQLVKELSERQGYCCDVCGQPVKLSDTFGGTEHPSVPDVFVMATFEHVVPASQGGKISEDNGTVTCFSCNSARGTMPYDIFKKIYQLFIKEYNRNHKYCARYLGRATTKIYNHVIKHGIHCESLPEGARKSLKNLRSL